MMLDISTQASMTTKVDEDEGGEAKVYGSIKMCRRRRCFNLPKLRKAFKPEHADAEPRALEIFPDLGVVIN